LRRIKENNESLEGHRESRKDNKKGQTCSSKITGKECGERGLWGKSGTSKLEKKDSKKARPVREKEWGHLSTRHREGKK